MEIAPQHYSHPASKHLDIPVSQRQQRAGLEYSVWNDCFLHEMVFYRDGI